MTRCPWTYNLLRPVFRHTNSPRSWPATSKQLRSHFKIIFRRSPPSQTEVFWKCWFRCWCDPLTGAACKSHLLLPYLTWTGAWCCCKMGRMLSLKLFHSQSLLVGQPGRLPWGQTCNAGVSNADNPALFWGAKILPDFLKGSWQTGRYIKLEGRKSSIFLHFPLILCLLPASTSSLPFPWLVTSAC